MIGLATPATPLWTRLPSHYACHSGQASGEEDCYPLKFSLSVAWHKGGANSLHSEP
jgi:hypothetical protein